MRRVIRSTCLVRIPSMSSWPSEQRFHGLYAMIWTDIAESYHRFRKIIGNQSAAAHASYRLSSLKAIANRLCWITGGSINIALRSCDVTESDFFAASVYLREVLPTVKICERNVIWLKSTILLACLGGGGFNTTDLPVLVFNLIIPCWSLSAESSWLWSGARTFVLSSSSVVVCLCVSQFTTKERRPYTSAMEAHSTTLRLLRADHKQWWMNQWWVTFNRSALKPVPADWSLNGMLLGQSRTMIYVAIDIKSQ